jgi:hypothetical protein
MKQRPRILIWLLMALRVCFLCASAYLLHHTHGSIQIWCGLLKSSEDPYLDNPQGFFQSCSWHLGNNRRTWGETYGVKVKRLYISMAVKHTIRRLVPWRQPKTSEMA